MLNALPQSIELICEGKLMWDIYIYIFAHCITLLNSLKEFYYRLKVQMKNV